MLAGKKKKKTAPKTSKFNLQMSFYLIYNILMPLILVISTLLAAVLGSKKILNILIIFINKKVMKL